MVLSTHGDHQNGELPPSTFAAQIVHNHEKATEPSRDGQRAAFGHLIQEILNNRVSEETDYEVNYKLVRVVTEAGLDVFLQDDPFVRRGILVEQAKNCILVIERTIQRNPALLLFPEKSQNESSEQLLFWVLPRILVLLGNPKADGIQQMLQSLLACLVLSLLKSSDTWQNGLSYLDVYKSCADDLLCALQQLNVAEKSMSLAVDLPPPLIPISFSAGPQQSIAQKQIPQCQISEPEHALRLVLAFIEIVVGICQSRNRDCIPAAPGRNLRMWVLQKCSAVWAVSSKWPIWLGSKNNVHLLTESFLRVLRSATVWRDPTREANVLIQVLSELLSRSELILEDLAVQREIAKCVLVVWELSITMNTVKRTLVNWLAPALLKFRASAISFSRTSKTLKFVVLQWMVKHKPAVQFDREIHEHDPADMDDASIMDELDDIELQAAFRRLELDHPSENENRPTKRPKLAQTFSNFHLDRYSRLESSICSALSKLGKKDMGDVQAKLAPSFLNLPEPDQLELLTTLAQLPCAASISQQPLVEPMMPISTCFLCDRAPPWDDVDPQVKDHAELSTGNTNFVRYRDPIRKFFSALVTLPAFQKTPKPRILAMLAVRRFLLHDQHSDELDLHSSVLGQYCLKSLHSSLRELRIVGGLTLIAFVRQEVPNKYRHPNRVLALDYLRQLSGREEVKILETTIFAWGQVAQVCGDEELNLAILQLVEFLGHTNSLICGLAFNELVRLSEARGCYPEELLKPFSKSISISVVKDLLIRPQKVQQLADLLRIGVNQYLLATEITTLPYLVLAKRRDVLARLASAHDQGTTIQDICMQPRANLIAILSRLLLEPAIHPETAVIESLCEVAPGFADYDLASLVKLDSILIMCEMLKAAGDANASEKPQIYRAIQQTAALVEAKNSRSSAKQGRAMLAFFEQHILGIMAHFSDVIENGRIPWPILEKKRCLCAIEETLGLSKGRVSIALPQLRACLQSALDVPDLQELAFSAWAMMITTAEEGDACRLVDHTFAIVAQKWETFSEKTSQQAQDVVFFLVKNYEAHIRESINTIPSLAHIPIFAKVDGEIHRFKASTDLEEQYRAFAARCRDENGVIVTQALAELESFLEANSQFIHDSASSEHPNSVIAELIRSILDACVAFKEDQRDISVAGAKCLGIIGCIDPSRIDNARGKRDILILSNLERASEVIHFVALLLESVLVKAFRSATNARSQGFLAYVMQELLKFCGFNEGLTPRSRTSDDDPRASRWQHMPISIRTTLTPFLTSRYLLTSVVTQSTTQSYPIFRKHFTHSMWLRTFASDLLRKGKGENAQAIFSTLSRVIHGQDVAIPAFLLPFAVLNVVVGGIDREVEEIQKELLTILSQPIHSTTLPETETIRQCSVNVFEILDYMSRWMHEKKKTVTQMQTAAQRLGATPPEAEVIRDTSQISSVERILLYVPAAIVASRAMECRSYARAIYHWEIHIRQEGERGVSLHQQNGQSDLYERLQEMYAYIDEPDAVEGLSSILDFVKPNQQLAEHVRLERWDAIQTWYELHYDRHPNDTYAQAQIARSLHEAGQSHALLDMIDRLHNRKEMCHPDILVHGVEASWMTSRWQDLQKCLDLVAGLPTKPPGTEFDIAIGEIMLRLHRRDWGEAEKLIAALRGGIATGFSMAATISFQSCRDQLRNLHVLYELEAISGLPPTRNEDRKAIREKLDRRLPVLGAFTNDKQALLRLRRRAMELSQLSFTGLDEASTLTESARMARKACKMGAAYSSIIRAQELRDDSALIEHARTLWKDGQHRNAIKVLEGAIELAAFRPPESDSGPDTMTGLHLKEQNLLAARVQLLWARWLDASGQTQSQTIIEKYQTAIRSFARWEKGHYYLGKHYNKLLESEKALPPTKQSPAFLCGETAKLVIDNYLRSIPFGNKYIYQTLPRAITLWLEVASDVQRSNGVPDSTHNDRRQRVLEAIHRQVRKYCDRMPAFAFYTALPQLMTRITHPHPEVWKILQSIITKIVSHHPQQALWSIMAVVKSSDRERSSRGLAIINSLRSNSKKGRSGKDGLDLRTLINHGQRLSDALLKSCEIGIDSKTAHVSLARNLEFNHSIAPCLLVIPLEATLTAAVPAKMVPEGIKNHKAFSREPITIAAFEDDVLVLNSLQRPRKLSVRGTDGKLYGLLCKPKDDLRKDQRLMEFNAMINRALKRDTEASKRRLYIKTYGVTPLNEECGAIEWVEGLKPIRDIMFQNYRNRGTKIDYNEMRSLLNAAIADQDEATLKEYWIERLVKRFPPVLHEWFIESFPEPEAWFAARLRYTRSCAVMSMVGYVLGLGDRHGENVLLQEGHGGVFHVDFNCLFDKGLTFEKPELVPFRLTHNMVDAMGAYGYEGPFRKSAELTMGILRVSEDTLMTILETFLYDPTQDFIGKKNRKANAAGVPETPREVLDSVRAKLRGLMRGESVPLSIEGHVEALIQMAVDDRNLASMYIGWCAFW
ncbi:MAG: serine/threonine-protein kinase M1 [Bathelium mastoideum]|nr:MAG: serine/threonine-protein kinase M1 [Bathelium mastoideum]